MADVEMETEVGQWIEQRGKLRNGVELAGKVLDHQTDVVFAGHNGEFAQTLQVAIDHEGAVVHRDIVVGVEIHPTGAQLGKDAREADEFVHGGAADGFKRAGEREVVSRMTDDGQMMFFQGGAEGVWIDLPGAGFGRFQGEIHKLRARGARSIRFR